jgi:hypothetical protein
MENHFAGGLLYLPYPTLIYGIKRAADYSGLPSYDDSELSDCCGFMHLYRYGRHAFSPSSSALDAMEILLVRFY